MKALILLTTNPGFHERGTSVIAAITKRSGILGVSAISTMHVFGRFDGVVQCECSDTVALNALAEALRKDGVFHTETLIAIE